MKPLRKIWGLVAEAGKQWSQDNASRLGAALSYYTVFSIAPLLLIVVAVAGLFLGNDRARDEVLSQVQGLVGGDAAGVVKDAIEKAREHQTGGIISTIVGFATLLLGATGVMLELQAALNVVWKVVPKPGLGVLRAVRERLLSLGLILTFGFLLLVSLVVSAGLAALGHFVSGVLPGWRLLAQVINVVISLGVVASLFAVLFKALPDARVAWKDVWIGAGVTAALFQIGKIGIGLYLGKATTTTAFGAAGSLAVLLVWVYYSSQILLFGAELTWVYASRYGSRIVPTEDAQRAPGDAAPGGHPQPAGAPQAEGPRSHRTRRHPASA